MIVTRWGEGASRDPSPGSTLDTHWPLCTAGPVSPQRLASEPAPEPTLRGWLTAPCHFLLITLEPWRSSLTVPATC